MKNPDSDAYAKSSLFKPTFFYECMHFEVWELILNIMYAYLSSQDYFFYTMGWFVQKNHQSHKF